MHSSPRTNLLPAPAGTFHNVNAVARSQWLPNPIHQHCSPLAAARQIKCAASQAPLPRRRSSAEPARQHRTRTVHRRLNLSKHAEGKAGAAHARLGGEPVLRPPPQTQGGFWKDGARQEEQENTSCGPPRPTACCPRDHSSSCPVLGGQRRRAEGGGGGPEDAAHPAQAGLLAAADGKSFVLQKSKAAGFKALSSENKQQTEVKIRIKLRGIT